MSVLVALLRTLLIALVCIAAAPPPAPAEQAPARKPARKQATQPAFEELAAKATAAREQNRLEEAIALYRRAVARRSDWAEGWWYLGTMLYELDRCPDALEPFRKVTGLQPTNGPALVLLGLCEFQTREFQAALQHMERGRALGLAGHRQLESVSRFHVALALIQEREYERALHTLSSFARQGESNDQVIDAFGLAALQMPLLPAEIPAEKRELVRRTGLAAYQQGARDLAEAGRQFEALVAAYPCEPGVHYAYGTFLISQRPDEALEQFRLELERATQHVPARLQIAFEYLKRNEPKPGLPFAEEAVRLAPKLFAARYALGRLLLDNGDTARAIEQLEEAARLAPNSPETRFALATAYSRAGRKDEAARERAEFMRLDKLRQESARVNPERPDAPESAKP